MNIHFNPAILMWTDRGTKVLTHCHLGIWGTAPGYLGKIKNEVIDRDKGKDPEGWITGTAVGSQGQVLYPLVN